MRGQFNSNIVSKLNTSKNSLANESRYSHISEAVNQSNLKGRAANSSSFIQAKESSLIMDEQI